MFGGETLNLENETNCLRWICSMSTLHSSWSNIKESKKEEKNGYVGLKEHETEELEK